MNYLVAAGVHAGLLVALAGLGRPGRRPAARTRLGTEDGRRSPARERPEQGADPAAAPASRDLAVLAFVASLVFMALEMVAGRLVTRHLGSSIYGWTSVIAVLLAGLSLGNFLGGKIADFIKNEKQASWLFLVGVDPDPVGHRPGDAAPVVVRQVLRRGKPRSVLSQAIRSRPALARVRDLAHLALPHPGRRHGRLLPPRAVDGDGQPRGRQAGRRPARSSSSRTGTAIGQVYAWGMVGSILGTFLTGFVLIDMLGTKGVAPGPGDDPGVRRRPMLGRLWHAVWAGIPLGLCVIAFTPPRLARRDHRRRPQRQRQGVRGDRPELGHPRAAGDPDDKGRGYAWVDESDYYYIKVENEPEDDGEIQRRTLVLDNLIHGYFILDHPERLDYDYEHIYALVAYRAAKAGGKVNFKPTPEAGPPGAELRPRARSGSRRRRDPPPKPARAAARPRRARTGQARRSRPAKAERARRPGPPTAAEGRACPPPKPAAPPAPAKEDSAKSGAGIPEHRPPLPGARRHGRRPRARPPPRIPSDAPVPDEARRSYPMAKNRRPVPPSPGRRDQGPQGHLRTWRRRSTGRAARASRISRQSSRRA